MKKLFLFLFAAAALTACDDKNETQVRVTGIALDRTEATLDAGATLQLTATVTPSDAADPVEWSSDNLVVATVSDSGLVEALTAGKATVTAKCGDFTATCVVSVNKVVEYDVISFEAEEGMTAIDGTAVTPGEIEVVGGMAAGKHQHVFWAQPYAALYGDPDGVMGVTFDAPLFTSDNNVWFGSYYCDCANWGARMDTWGGFVLSQNCNTTAESFSYTNQFSVYAESGANSTKTFAVAYCNTIMGGDYNNPIIEFASTPRRVASLCMAASTMLHTYYAYDFTAPADRTYSYRITGSLRGETVGYVDVELVKNSQPTKGWVNVDLSNLGEVDKLTFTPEGINPTMDFDPVYFCLDEIRLVKE